MKTAEILRRHLAEILKLQPEQLQFDAHVMDELGADSLQFLDYIAAVEKEFGIVLKGSDSDRFATLRGAADFLDRSGFSRKDEPDSCDVIDVARNEPVQSDEGASKNHKGGIWLDEFGNLHCPVEIGMPLTGRNNLGETPLLKLIGDLRWKHVELFSGVPSKDLCDDTGERLYATFFYVEANFEIAGSMACFGENDRLHVVSSLRSSGGSVLDGSHWLIRDPGDEQAIPEDPSSLGVPYLRTSNIFVKMLDGAQWLKKSKPCQPGMGLIPSADGPPDTAELCREADQNDGFEGIPEGWLSLSEQPVEAFYDIVPDRDLNGAGLLYFANYPQILDVVEREILEELLPVKFEDVIVDRRATVRRQSAYLSNASQSDRIRVSARVAVEDPFSAAAAGNGTPEEQPVNLWLNFVMWRCSDDRKMMVSTVRKTFTETAWRDTSALDGIRERSRRESVTT